VRNGIFDAQYEYATKVLEGKAQNNRFLPMIYELDDPSEWDKPEMWIKANPGLGTIKRTDYLAEMVQKAKADPSFKPTVLVKDFNIPQTAQTAWMRFEDLNNEEMIPGDAEFRYCIGGFDAADSIDLNAAKAICKRPNDDRLYVKQMYWIPQDVLDKQEESGDRRERDSVPYSLWVSQGLMRTCPGKKVDKRVILDWFCELRDQEDIWPLYIGYDPWHISDELLRAFESEFGKSVMIPVRQGVLTLSQPMKELKADFQEKRIVYNNHPIDKWCLINTEEKKDINGNTQPVKSDDRTRRIDGTAALLDAYVIYLNKKDEFESLM
jgi:phage terminase large subunit-like protein